MAIFWIRVKLSIDLLYASGGDKARYKSKDSTGPLPARNNAGAAPVRSRTVVGSAGQSPPSIIRSTFSPSRSRISAGLFNGISSPGMISVELNTGAPSSVSNAWQIGLSGTLIPTVLRRL